MAAVDDLLTCAVCLDWFKSPRRLPCHHVYCLECLRGLVTRGINYVTCPECRRRHLLPRGGADEYPLDGRLEHFMEILKKTEPDSCQVCKQYSPLSECDHCRLTTCQQCQVKHKAQLLESLLKNVRKYHKDFSSEKQKTSRQKLKTQLLRHQKNLGVLKVRIDQEIDSMVNELENRRVTLLSSILEEETLILDKLSDVEKVEVITGQLSFTPGVVETNSLNSLTKAVICMKDELAKQKQLVTSLRVGCSRKGLLSILFNDEQKLKEMVSSYGAFFTAIDYKNEFTLLTTLDGSDSGGVFNRPWGLTVCPLTDNIYVTDRTSIREYNNNGEYLRHIVTNDVPRGLAIDRNQRVIVTSYRENNVKIYNRHLQLIKSFGCYGDQNGQFSIPSGVACDVDNNIYVVDRDNKRVQVFTPDGSFLSEIGRGILNGPRCIQINLQQEVLVTNSDQGHVDIFSIGGAHLRTVIGAGENPLKIPRGIAVDRNGYILVSDQQSKIMEVYNDDGTHHCKIIKPTAAMNDVTSLAVTSSGVICITNWISNKIHLIATTHM